MRGLRDSGLGDPDEAELEAAGRSLGPADDELLGAARELLAEARALRGAMVG
jgi:hypothetical protein